MTSCLVRVDFRVIIMLFIGHVIKHQRIDGWKKLYHWISFYVKIETLFQAMLLFRFIILAKLQSGHRIKLHLLNRRRNIELRKWLWSFDNRRRCFEQDAGTISSQPSCAANRTTAASSYQQQFHTSDRGPRSQLCDSLKGTACPWDSAVWDRSVQVCHQASSQLFHTSWPGNEQHGRKFWQTTARQD